MKNILKTALILTAAFVLACLVVLQAQAKTEDRTDYLVTEGDSGYTLSLSKDGAWTEISSAKSLSDLIFSIKNGKIIFDSVSSEERLVLSDSTLVLEGALEFLGDAGLSVERSTLTLSSLDLSFENGSLKNKSASITLNSSTVTSDTATVVQDFDDSASLTLNSGEISSSSLSPALRVSRGTVRLLGGKVSSLGEYALENSATLLLSGTDFSSSRSGIFTENPITLADRPANDVRVTLDTEFTKGTMTAVLYNAQLSDCERVRVFDKNGKEYLLSYFDSSEFSEETHFAAVYLPFTVTFKSGEEITAKRDVLYGKTVSAPEYTPEAGFEFDGWYRDATFTAPYRFDTEVVSDMTLFAAVRLVLPEYRITSGVVVYDGKVHYFSLDYLNHPLFPDATAVYQWYKDGVLVGAGEKLALSRVSDSGEYSCTVSVYYGRYSVSITTVSARFTVKKATVKVPEIPSVFYTAKHQELTLTPNNLYTVECSGGVGAGAYPVTLTLKDAENYAWETADGAAVTKEFLILRAGNSFLCELSAFDLYFLSEDTFTAQALFGEVRLIYYAKGSSVALSELPKASGEYSVVATVDETADYTALVSAPQSFKILEEKALGISILSMPYKTEYLAFEKFSPAGLTVSVSYSSGRSETVGAEKLSIKYQSADSLRQDDNAVFVSYGGVRACVEVSVEPCEYNLSGIIFSDITTEYTSSYISAPVPVGLPVGLDGIPLTAYVEGGGAGVGTYSLKLVFVTDSTNYKVPTPLFATLKITKKSTVLTWNTDGFVYSGKKQAPSAYFSDLSGTRVWVSVSGGEYDAGDGYLAFASENPNYEFTNPTCSFSIKKADFDLSGITWSEKSLVYDGTERTVTLSGLPDGMRVTGYANNSAVLVGEYIATASFAYDEKNYNPPSISAHKWSITKADYPLDNDAFLDNEAVFDGGVHYPVLNAQMPTGNDGITLKYSFSGGATHVFEGAVSVTVSFYTESPNYNAPQPIIRTVKILPLPINVTWQQLVFTYDAKDHSPTASASECGVTVTGAMSNAGTYIATAAATDTDYTVTNANIEFTIQKATNIFTLEPYVRDSFEGHTPKVGGEALFGKIEFIFYSDFALNEKADEPLSVGVYYAVAQVPESENYMPLVSKAIPFKINAVVAVGIKAKVNGIDIRAFDTLNADTLTVELVYNDGSVSPVDFSAVTVKYQNGSSLRTADTAVTVAYCDFSALAEVKVNRADYDLSGVVWQNLTHTYDGEEKRPEILGLPSGVTLEAMPEETEAGEYLVYPVLAYDTENYNPPAVAPGKMTINRAKIAIPAPQSAIYTGQSIFPEYSSPHFTANISGTAKDAGIYTVNLTLNDAKNYCFENGKDTASVDFTIQKKDIRVKVGSVTVYLFEEYENPSVEILDGLVTGDSVDFAFTVNDGKISVKSLNPNYGVIEELGTVTYSHLPSKEVRTFVFYLLVIIILLTLLVLTLVLKRDEIMVLLKGGIAKRKISKMALDGQRDNPKPVIDLGTQAKNIPHLESFITPMDSERADSLISNSLAKDLIKTQGESVMTEGRRKSVINIDTLSDNFLSGDRVDVNALKSKSLIPYDTGYIKVLARGVIDKPLFVYANDFSSTAVKMLALTGGAAFKVATVKIKPTDTDHTEN